MLLNCLLYLYRCSSLTEMDTYLILVWCLYVCNDQIINENDNLLMTFDELCAKKIVNIIAFFCISEKKKQKQKIASQRHFLLNIIRRFLFTDEEIKVSDLFSVFFLICFDDFSEAILLRKIVLSKFVTPIEKYINFHLPIGLSSQANG